MDRLPQQGRSALMARIRGSNTGIEMTVRLALHRMGFRYRLGGCGLTGRPDIVLPRWKAVVFVHGCFWHGHDCPLFRLPKTRPEFWAGKINNNRERDLRNLRELLGAGYRVATVWECALRRDAASAERSLVLLASWLEGNERRLDLHK
jgi:DNA mismatch endonuclease (patch repair protein)